MEDENNLNVGNTTLGEGLNEMVNMEDKDDDRRGFDFSKYSLELLHVSKDSVEKDRCGFDFGEYSLELLPVSKDSVEKCSSLLHLNGNNDDDSDCNSEDDGGNDEEVSCSSNNKNNEVYVDESQQGCAMQVVLFPYLTCT